MFGMTCVYDRFHYEYTKQAKLNTTSRSNGVLA